MGISHDPVTSRRIADLHLAIDQAAAAVDEVKAMGGSALTVADTIALAEIAGRIQTLRLIASAAFPRHG